MKSNWVIAPKKTLGPIARGYLGFVGKFEVQNLLIDPRFPFEYGLKAKQILDFEVGYKIS